MTKTICVRAKTMPFWFYYSGVQFTEKMLERTLAGAVGLGMWEEEKADFGQLRQKTSPPRNTVCTWSCRICWSWSRSSATLRLISSRLMWTAEGPAVRGWLVCPEDSRVLRVFPPDTWGAPMREEQQRT